MKRSLVILIMLCGMSVYAVPAMRPVAPDVRSEVPSSESDYTPGVIKQHEDVKPTSETKPAADNEEYEEIDEEADTEDIEVDSEPVETGEFNPINTDATNDNVKNNNYNPPQNIDTSDSSVKTKQNKTSKSKKKQKKTKDPYKGYRDAANDPYINSLNKETTSDAPQKQKTYTQDDYEQAYRDMEVPTFSYVHGVDPDQYYDMKDTMWSPYPLLRLNSPLYFKTITVEPGYYLLTPREYKGSWYILFKEAGAVKYTIPVFSKDYTPEFYYRDNLPELEMKKSQRWQIKFLNSWGKYIRKSKRKPPITCNIELTDLDNNFLLLDLYYGPHKYSTIFRIEKF